MAVGDQFKKRRNLVQKSAASKPGAGSGLFSYYTDAGMNPYVPNSPMQTNAQPQMQNPMVPKSILPSSGQSGSQMLNDRMQAASMRDLALKIDAIREQSQATFPTVAMSPTYGVTNPDVESARRLAPMLTQDAARQQNTPVNGNTAYANNPMRYNAGDPAIQMRQQDNAQRMTSGRPVDRTRGAGDRFAGSAGRINAEYDKVKAGQGIFSNGEFLDFTPTGNPQWGTAENMRRRVELDNAPQQATQEQRYSAQARRAGIQREFIDRTGMNYAQARRAERKEELRQRTFNKAVIRGMNPFGPDAQALFPQQVSAAKAGAAGQGGAVKNPMANAGRTLEEQQAAAMRIQERETTNPVVAGLGAEPGTGLVGLNEAFRNRLVEDPAAEFSDDSLREYQSHAKDYKGVSTDANNPFEFGTSIEDKYQAELWKELAELPDNSRARAEWLQRYKARTAEAKAAADKPSTPTYGNPYGYAAPYSNTFNRGVKPIEMYKNPMK